MKKFLFVLMAILSAGTGGMSPSAAAGERLLIHSGFQRPAEVKSAPDFILKDIEGLSKGLRDYQGRVVLVHFWATWCIPCKDELPTINALWDKFKDQGLVIVAVAEDSKKAVEPFAKENNLKFTVLIDQYGKAFRSYGVRALPTSYLVNRTGNIEGIAIGQRDWSRSDTEELINGLLK